MATEAVTEVTTEAGSEETEKDIADVKDSEEKTDKALELYADIEKVVEANHLEADKEFTDMKKQLTDMATEVKGKLAQAKEEDAKLALQEIDGIIDNLTKVKN